MDAPGTTTNDFFSEGVIPDDVWALVFQSLPSQSIVALRLVVNNMGRMIGSESIKNMLIQKINDRQKKEIAYLSKKHAGLVFDHMQDPATTIEIIKERSKELDEINSQLILSEIGNGTSTTLDLSTCRITRFPGSLMQIQALQDNGYWQKLQRLDCSNNQLTALPALDACVALQELYCNYNQLTALPALDACVALKWLYCDNNQLTALPALDACVALHELNCDNNQLIALPALDACLALRELYCNDNQLTALPALDACVALKCLPHYNNQLTALPQYLLNRGFRLGHQTPPPAPALITPAFNQGENKRKLDKATVGDAPNLDTETDEPNSKKQKINK